MKKAIAMVMVVVMMLALGVTAFAAQGPLTMEQAKQVALDYAGVKAADATFTKAHRDYDNGRQVYEIEFYRCNKSICLGKKTKNCQDICFENGEGNRAYTNS